MRQAMMLTPVIPDRSDARDRDALRITRRVAIVGLAVVGVSLTFAVARSATDVVAVAGVVAFVALVAALVAHERVTRGIASRRSAREAGQTRMLQGMSRSASSEAVVEAIVDELRRTVDADHICVCRLRPIDRVVETTLVSSRAIVPPSRSTLPASVLQADPQETADDLASRVADSYALAYTLARPLMADGRVVGALILSRRQPREWSEADHRLLEWSAGELSAALERAFAFEDAEIKASIDALTGLPNRRYLQELLATAGRRRRASDRLGALMIDIDHFKRLNDRYGHATGDRVLRAVGEAISGAVRADDTPARYGGEEFAVLLRRADSDQALDVGERIRSTIADLPPADLGLAERITVSVGVAVADPAAADASTILAAADQALYRAKREGRNRVVLAG
jgi:diguanylate cyclase (GGDEF)-like protein